MSDTVSESVFYVHDKEGGKWPPEKLKDFIIWCAEKLHSVPVEYRDSAKIEISIGEYEYGEFNYGNIWISYERPKSEEELKKEEEKRIALAAEVRDRDLRELAKLKARYER